MTTSQFDSTTPAPAAESPLSTWKPWHCRLVGTAVALHLAAIVIAPWAVPPASLIAQDCFGVFGPYIEATYLNHGYHFFAPEPGPSHLVRYEVPQSDGSVVRGTFPDRKGNWPRLMYHRHFMLTEHLNGFAEGEQTEALETHTRSYARHLMKKHRGTEARLFLIRHHLPSPQEVLDGKKLNDPSLYQERALGTFKATEI